MVENLDGVFAGFGLEERTETAVPNTEFDSVNIIPFCLHMQLKCVGTLSVPIIPLKRVACPNSSPAAAPLRVLCVRWGGKSHFFAKRFAAVCYKLSQFGAKIHLERKKAGEARAGFNFGANRRL